VDISWEDGGIRVRTECVSMFEPADYWSTTIQPADGVEVLTALHNGDDEAAFLRRVQDKIRRKTIGDDGSATKFPEPDTSTVHIIAADVSQGAGWLPDRWDLELIALGRRAVHPYAQRNLLGLFESANQYGPGFDEEFRRNEFLRSRVHALLFLVDESRWRSSLDPCYTGCMLLNPNVSITYAQTSALNRMGHSLEGFVEWMTSLRIVTQS